MKTDRQLYILFVLLAFCGFCLPARARDLTAFQLIKEGNRYVGEDSKDKVVQIRSEKSIGTLTPNIWYVVYYDPDATFKATEVKFGAGEKMEVKRPMRVLEFGNDASKTLDRKKMRVDSDKAIKIGMQDPLLANLKVTASQLTLEHGDEGPTWRVRLWAATPRNPEREVDIGAVYLSADDGKVFRRDLHVERLN